MASASITKLGGVVVVTQVIPQDEEGQIPMQASKAPPQASQAPPTPSFSPKMDDMTVAFLKGEPEVLGVIQIIIGLLCVLFSLTAIFSPVLVLHAPLCIGIVFVVSGSLALKAKRNTSVCLVWVTLVLNLLSVVFSLGCVAYLGWRLGDVPPSELVCGGRSVYIPDPSSYRNRFDCNERMRVLDVVVYGLCGFLLLLLVLQACVSITLSVFCGKALRLSDRYGPIQVLVSDYDSDVGLLDPETSTATLNSP